MLLGGGNILKTRLWVGQLLKGYDQRIARLSLVSPREQRLCIHYVSMCGDLQWLKYSL